MIPAIIITAPRPVSYLNRTVASVQSAGFDLHGIHRDHCRAGSYPNFRRALGDVCRRRPDAEAYAVFEDDVLVSRHLADWLQFNRPDGVASLYCPSLYHSGHRGWQDVDLSRGLKPSEASCGLVFPADAAARFVEESRWERPCGLGFAVGQWCRDSGTPYLRHVPSLVSHIGKVSAIRGKEDSAVRREAEFVHDVTAIAGL